MASWNSRLEEVTSPTLIFPSSNVHGTGMTPAEPVAAVRPMRPADRLLHGGDEPAAANWSAVTSARSPASAGREPRADLDDLVQGAFIRAFPRARRSAASVSSHLVDDDRRQRP